LEAAITYLDSVGKEESLCVNTEMEFADIAIRFS